MPQALWSNGLGKRIPFKMILVITLLWSLESMIHKKPEVDTILAWKLAWSWSMSTNHLKKKDITTNAYIAPLVTQSTKKIVPYIAKGFAKEEL